ncbi:MAG: SMP-30/gluconolactonase/LRE family protein, partial [Planctomycetaceae bacterium]
MMLRRPTALLTLLVLSTPLAAAEPIPGVGPVGEIQKVRGEFQFTEGPAWDGQKTLYFSDIPANRIYAYAPGADGKQFSVFQEPSNHANGLMVTADGQLYACQMDGRVVKIDPKTKKVTVIAAEYDGKRFNAPNDLVIDKQGGVYFTDPMFRAPEPLPQGVQAVYYASADGKVTRLVDDVAAPNGVILSPDEKTLYVIPTRQEEMMAYAVEGPGQLGKGRVFCKLKQAEGQTGRGGDGLTIDT